MTKIAATGLATAVAIALLGGSSLGPVRAQSEPAAISAPAPRAPALDIGQCQIRYEALAEDKQPAAMECEHAEWIAQRWGGRVMEQTREGLVERAAFEGGNDFTGVPSEALPRRGYCRAWIDGAPLEAQPEQSDCRVARTVANERGGRVLFMPV